LHKLNLVKISGLNTVLKINFAIFILFLSVVFPKPTFSQATVEYHNISKGNTIKGALSISFPEGWNTYWKFPGPNGFTPSLKVLKKENLSSFKVVWPFPKKLGPDGFTYLGYDEDIMLPIELIKMKESSNLLLEVEISFGICKKVCLVQSKTLTISDKGKINDLVLKKFLRSENKIISTTNFGKFTKCKIKKVNDNDYQLTFENYLLRNSKTISSALVDYEGTSWTIEEQSFYPEFGVVKAFIKPLKAKKRALNLKHFTLLYLDKTIANKTVACPS
jgi:hypothetical protein